MASRCEELTVGFRRDQVSHIKGPRTRYMVTFNPNKASPGEVIHVSVPRLKDDACLIPDTLCLSYDFKNKNTKSWFNNNLGRLIVKELKIRVYSETVYENTGESMLGVYRDLWLPEKVRTNMVEDGIAGEAVRKKISKNDETNDGALAVKTLEVYGTRQRIRLGHILKDHGLYTAYNMGSNFQYVITLPKAEDIMTAQSSESVEGYSLENIELEYETIDNSELANDIRSRFQVGRSLSFEHATRVTTEEWQKESTIQNITVNIPRKSMKAIVLFFSEGTETGTEKFVYPNLENIKVTIEGIPSAIYNQGIIKRRMFEEAQRLFEYHNDNPNMSYDNFFRGDKFAAVVDLRSICDKHVTGSGRKLTETQSGIMLEIKKKATTTNVKCHIFVLSDGLVNIVDGNSVSVQY